MNPSRTLFIGASQVVACAGPAPRRGRALDDPSVLERGSVLVSGDAVERVGPERDLLELTGAARASGELSVVDVGGRAIVPGFVDPHTHVVFAGNRAAEFEMRVRGKTYLEILQAGGGILDTVSRVRAASPAQLVDDSLGRLGRMLALGTTTAEVKSGYGLDLETEVAMLRAVRELAARQPVELVPTFLGAHACPKGVDRDEYTDRVAGEMLPEVVRQGLARFVDVFCDAGAFDCAQARRVLEAGKRHGLGLKLHADEIASIGATPLGVELGCTSLDHLERIADESIPVLAGSQTVGVLLPGTGFTLGIGFGPARRLIEAGAIVALATDCNPGSCYTESMPMIQTLACAGMKMSPGEALVASTLNAAHAIGLSDRVGSLEPGKQADLLVLEGSDYREIAYHFGSSPVKAVYKRGRLVHGTVG